MKVIQRPHHFRMTLETIQSRLRQGNPTTETLKRFQALPERVIKATKGEIPIKDINSGTIELSVYMGEDSVKKYPPGYTAIYSLLKGLGNVTLLKEETF